MRRHILRSVFAIALGATCTSSAWSQGVDAGGTAPTMTQKVTAVESGAQNQVNAATSFALPAIQSAIQQGLRGPRLGRRAEASPLFDAGHLGMAAGDSPANVQVWLQGGGGRSKSDLTIAGYTINNYGAVGGAQVQITPTFLIGASATWQETDGTLNSGFSSESTTYGISPYVGWQFSENWNLSGVVGYNSGHTHLGRLAPAYTARYRMHQWTAQGALTGSYALGEMRAAPTISFVRVQMNSHSFVDSAGFAVPGNTTHLTRGSVGGTLSYPLSGWEPYVRAAFEYDFSVPAGAGPHGRSGGAVGAGASFAFSEKAWGSLDLGYNSLGRSDLSMWSVLVRLTLLF